MNSREVYIENEDKALLNYVSSFLDIEVELGLSVTTINHHRSVLERFAKIGSVNTIRKNGVKAIELFFSSCNDTRKMSEFSQKSYFSVIKKFLNFLNNNGVIEEKIVADVEKHRFLLPDVKPFFFCSGDDEKIFLAMKKKPKNRGGEVFERNVMILKLMRLAGMRPIDVREVRINDIYSNNRGVYHIPFGEKRSEEMPGDDYRKEVTINEHLIASELSELQKKGYQYLCESPKSKRVLSTDELGLMSKTFQKNAAIKKPLGLMAYRHTYIKELCESGLEVDTIRKKVHLSSKRAIMNYFHILDLKTPKE